jgi:kynurenine formamidase
MTTIVDLTHVIREGMIGHPFHGRTPIKLAGSLNHWIYASTTRLNPYDGTQLSFANEQWVLNGNTGTHMDSVWHADPDGIGADEMPIECGFGSAIKLDVSFAKAPRAAITPEILERAEKESGEIVSAGDIVLIHTGWSELADTDPHAYLYDHMGLTKEGGEWLRARDVRTVGIDNSTVETVEGASESPVHMNFLKPASLGLPKDNFIAIIENLRNLAAVPAARFQFVGVPLPFEQGSGSPIRALAVIQ